MVKLILLAINILLCCAFVFCEQGNVDLDRWEFINLNPKYFGKISATAVKSKPPSTYLIGGNLELLKPLDDKFSFKFEYSAKEADGKYKKYFTKFCKGVCDCLNQDKTIYPDVIKSSNLPAQATCPIPAGTYKMADYEKFLKAPQNLFIKEYWNLTVTLYERDDSATVGTGTVLFKVLK